MTSSQNNSKVQNFVESRPFEITIMVVILLNAITLGLETIPSLSDSSLKWLHFIDRIFLSIFVVELLLRAVAYRLSFFKDPWRIFDLIIVGISLIPSSGPFAVVRSLRVLRTLRMISVFESLKKVVSGLMSAIPGLGAVGSIMVILFYVSAVMATKLFGSQFPEWFGDLGASSYSLFQVMTLESWSMGIVRPVLEVYPYAWVFFIPFILVTTFTMLNLFIAVIVNAMQAETDHEAEVRAEQGHNERHELYHEIKALRQSVEELKSQLK